MGKLTQTTFACLFLLFVAHVDAFSKYGRTCQDIGCLSSEECVMVEECDPVNRQKCNYPKCEKKRNFKPTCATTFCGGGQDCVINPIDGKPRCVDDPSKTGYNSAGVSVVNGQHTSNNNNNNNNHGSVSTNANPYANANAPPIDDAGRNNPVSSSTNYGYPPYSTNNNNNNGYSSGSSSSSGTNLGYPPYPTQNRMPMPGQSGVYHQVPPQAGGFYPGSSASGYPPYPPNQQYPSHSNYPYQTRNYNSNVHYPRYRNTSQRNCLARSSHVVLALLSLTIMSRYLS